MIVHHNINMWSALLMHVRDSTTEGMISELKMLKNKQMDASIG